MTRSPEKQKRMMHHQQIIVERMAKAQRTKIRNTKGWRQ